MYLGFPWEFEGRRGTIRRPYSMHPPGCHTGLEAVFTISIFSTYSCNNVSMLLLLSGAVWSFCSFSFSSFSSADLERAGSGAAAGVAVDAGACVFSYYPEKAAATSTSRLEHHYIGLNVLLQLSYLDLCYFLCDLPECVPHSRTGDKTRQFCCPPLRWHS